MPTCEEPGSANSRSLIVWSAQWLALIENGTTPGAGRCVAVDVNSPVSLSLRGNLAFDLVTVFSYVAQAFQRLPLLKLQDSD